MSFLQLAKKRQSTRKFKNTPVDRDIIKRCLEAARLAPSACNAQPWRFIIVDDEKLKEAVARETFSSIVPFNRFTLQAPVMVVIVTERPNLTAQIGGKLKDKEYSLIDIGIAAQHFCLQATQEGLGTCMLGWFNEKPIKKLLNIPKQKGIGLLIALGYPESDQIKPKKRKAIEQIAEYNSYYSVR